MLYNAPEIIVIFIVRDSASGFKLVAEEGGCSFTTTSEKLSIENCIKLTERLIANYNNLQDYENTCNALRRMKMQPHCTNVQMDRMNLILDEAMKMSQVLHLSLKTARQDRQRDFLPIVPTRLGVSQVPGCDIFILQDEDDFYANLYANPNENAEQSDSDYVSGDDLDASSSDSDNDDLDWDEVFGEPRPL